MVDMCIYGSGAPAGSAGFQAYQMLCGQVNGTSSLSDGTDAITTLLSEFHKQSMMPY